MTNLKASITQLLQFSYRHYIEQEILPSINWFDSVLSIDIRSFAYPYGYGSNTIDAALYKYFDQLRYTYFDINGNRYVESKLSGHKIIYGLAIDENNAYAMQDLGAQLLDCKFNNSVRVFYAHNTVDSVSNHYEISYAKLDSLMKYAANLDLSFYTFNELYTENN